jgi:hypothetical protein
MVPEWHLSGAKTVTCGTGAVLFGTGLMREMWTRDREAEIRIEAARADMSRCARRLSVAF